MRGDRRRRRLVLGRAVAEGRTSGSPPKLGRLSIVDFEVLRLGFDEIPEDVLEREARRLLGNHANGVRSKRLSKTDVEDLVGVFLDHHRQLRNQTAGEVATVGEAFLALGLAAGARAAGNASAAGASGAED